MMEYMTDKNTFGFSFQVLPKSAESDAMAVEAVTKEGEFILRHFQNSYKYSATNYKRVNSKVSCDIAKSLKLDIKSQDNIKETLDELARDTFKKQAKMHGL